MISLQGCTCRVSSVPLEMLDAQVSHYRLVTCLALSQSSAFCLASQVGNAWTGWKWHITAQAQNTQSTPCDPGPALHRRLPMRRLIPTLCSYLFSTSHLEHLISLRHVLDMFIPRFRPSTLQSNVISKHIPNLTHENNINIDFLSNVFGIGGLVRLANGLVSK